MSKKSRKRNKKILAALAAGLGAAALIMRGRGTAADVDSGRGGDSSSAAARVAANAVTGTEYPGANKAAVANTSPISNNKFRTRGRITDSAGNTIDSAGMTLNRRANAVTGVDGPPSILNPYSNRNIRGRLTNRGVTFKSGGRVKGAGKAKRGLGRAFTKAKK